MKIVYIAFTIALLVYFTPKQSTMEDPKEKESKERKDKAKSKSLSVIMQKLKPILNGRVNVNEEYSITKTISEAIEQAQEY